jgi:hypothetical protein
MGNLIPWRKIISFFAGEGEKMAKRKVEEIAGEFETMCH